MFDLLLTYPNSSRVSGGLGGHLNLKLRHPRSRRFGSGSDVVRMWFGCGSDVAGTRLGCVSKRVPGAHGKRGLERGWQKRLAKGWRKVGEGLAKGLQRVGGGLAKGFSGFPCNLQCGIPEAPV